MDKQQFETGMKLSKAGKHTDAIAYLEQAISIEPNNIEYQKALSDTERDSYSRLYITGFKSLSARSLLLQ